MCAFRNKADIPPPSLEIRPKASIEVIYNPFRYAGLKRYDAH